MASKSRKRRPKRSIRSIFLPHTDNDRHPHLLRYGAISVVLLLILGVEFASVLQSSNLASSPTQLGAVLPAVVVDLTNQERSADNLSTLTPNARLTEAAQDVANDMVTQEYFAHVNPEGKTPWDWLDQVGYQYQYAGQNLAVNFEDSQQLMTAWMNSPEHKANILRDNFTQIGVALATGTYQGQQAVFVVQYFASPVQLASTQVSAPAAAPPASPAVAVQTPVPTTPTVAAAETSNSHYSSATPNSSIALDAYHVFSSHIRDRCSACHRGSLCARAHPRTHSALAASPTPASDNQRRSARRGYHRYPHSQPKRSFQGSVASTE